MATKSAKAGEKRKSPETGSKSAKKPAKKEGVASTRTPFKKDSDKSDNSDNDDSDDDSASDGEDGGVELPVRKRVKQDSDEPGKYEGKPLEGGMYHLYAPLFLSAC